MFSRIREMLIKEFIQVFRDPRMTGIIFIVPLVQTIIFGYAVTTDVKKIRVGIYDQDYTYESRNLISHFVNNPYFVEIANPTTDREVKALMDTGAVQMILRIEEGFEEELLGGERAKVQLLLDGTDSNTASIILSYSSRLLSQYSQEIFQEKVEALQGAVTNPAPLIELRSRAWFNENLESRNFFVPGIMAGLVMLVTLTLTSMAIVREKEIGTIEQILVTPISRFEFILGKIVPFILIGFIDVILVSVVAVYWFDIPIRGQLSHLFLATSLYILTTLGIGLMISTISQTQQQALMSAFLFFFPAILLSGFIFPIENMPPLIQWITYFNPLRYFLVIVRGIFLKGVGMDILWPQMAALAIMGICSFFLALQRFHKTME